MASGQISTGCQPRRRRGRSHRTSPPKPRYAPSSRNLTHSPPSSSSAANGLQAWWVLATPWLFKDDAERQEAQDLAERWLDELRRRLGKDLDGVANFDRILRLPFSRNQNTQRGVRVGPVLDTALEKQDGPRLSGDEWIGLSKDWPVEAKTTQDTTSGKKSRPDGSGPQSGPSFTLQADATPDSDWLEGLREKDALRDVLDERKGFESPSECDMSLASHLAGIFRHDRANKSRTRSSTTGA